MVLATLHPERAYLLHLVHCRHGEEAADLAIQDNQLGKEHRWDRQLLPVIQLAVVAEPVIPAPVVGILELPVKDLEVVPLGEVPHMPAVEVVVLEVQEELGKAPMLAKVARADK